MCFEPLGHIIYVRYIPENSRGHYIIMCTNIYKYTVDVVCLYVCIYIGIIIYLNMNTNLFITDGPAVALYIHSS